MMQSEKKMLFQLLFCVIFALSLCFTFVQPVQAAVKKPAKVTILSVKSSSAGKITVKWKKVSKAKGYQIAYSQNSEFKTQKTVKITGTSKTISGLSKGKKYYVRVRAYKKSGKTTKYGKWSSTKTVKVKKPSAKQIYAKAVSYYKKGKYKAAAKYFSKLKAEADESCVKKMSSAMKKAYKKKLSSKVKKGNSNPGSNPFYGNKITGYYLTDIDKDKKPELILEHHACSEADAYGEVFSYKKGKVVKIGRIALGHAGLYYDPRGNGLTLRYYQMNVDNISTVRIVKGKLKQTDWRKEGVFTLMGMPLPYILDNHTTYYGYIDYTALE